MRGANLSWANLSGVDLTGVDLSGVNLVGVNLDKDGAILTVRTVRETNLTGANLRELQHWTFEQFEQSGTLADATMPDGVKLRGLDNPDAPTYDEWKAHYLARQGSG